MEGSWDIMGDDVRYFLLRSRTPRTYLSPPPTYITAGICGALHRFTLPLSLPLSPFYLVEFLE